MKKAKSFLASKSNHVLRGKTPPTFIFVLDNVLDEDEETYESKGQRLRKATELEQIFTRAQLRVHKDSGRLSFHPEFATVMIWALH